MCTFYNSETEFLLHLKHIAGIIITASGSISFSFCPLKIQKSLGRVTQAFRCLSESFADFLPAGKKAKTFSSAACASVKALFTEYVLNCPLFTDN